MERNCDRIVTKTVMNTQLLTTEGLQKKKKEKRERAGKKRVLTITLEQKAFFVRFLNLNQKFT